MVLIELPMNASLQKRIHILISTFLVSVVPHLSLKSETDKSFWSLQPLKTAEPAIPDGISRVLGRASYRPVCLRKAQGKRASSHPRQQTGGRLSGA